MYLYDEHGSELFEQICELPEYYLTRTETEILESHADDIAAYSTGNMHLVELGSGSSTKTRLIIEALIRRQQNLHYLPVDISETMLVHSARELVAEYPQLKITAYAAEYHDALQQLKRDDLPHKTVLFLGSNIGNFEPEESLHFLEKVRSSLEHHDYFLLSADMRKPREVLEAAYNDAQGITAAFNLNILARINRELDGDFDIEQFEHHAFYNEKEGRVEIHIRSLCDQEVFIGLLGQTFSFHRGETIHTENSYKFTNAQIQEICKASGFRLVEQWTDARNFFSVNMLAPA